MANQWRVSILLLSALALASCSKSSPGSTPSESAASQEEGTNLVDEAIPDQENSDEPSGDSSSETPSDGTRPNETHPNGVRGIVWAPGNAPGMVPAGHEIPISGALVYLSQTRPEPIPEGVYCEYCIPAPPTAVVSNHRGRFEIIDFGPGDYWLIIQKGQFRREVPVHLSGTEIMALPAADTTLPSRNAREDGDTIPSIAIAVGVFDRLETILGKMHLGRVDGLGSYDEESAEGVVDIWDNGGCCYDGVSKGTLPQLMSDLEQMLKYHIIFIPCSTSEYSDALNDPAVLNNIRQYVNLGGKLYVTDWSGEWNDNVFPQQLELGGGGTDTPAEAYDAATGTWDTSEFGHADGEHYDTPNAEAVDHDLAQWLNGQKGPTADNTETSTYDASSFKVVGNWNFITATETVAVGVDDDGFPIYDEPHVFVIGGSEEEPLPKRPLTVTYEPAGCGRVLFSTYHTTDELHPGLVPQERILLYVIMEIGICMDPKE